MGVIASSRVSRLHGDRPVPPLLQLDRAFRSAESPLEKAVARYAGPKGNLQFPLDEPMSFGLIGRIVKLRVKQDWAKGAARHKMPR